MSILIIGGGEIGATLAMRLSLESQDIVLIEADDERVRELGESADVKVVHGNGSNPLVLREAGLEDAEMLIAVTNSDEVNIVASLVASAETVIPTKIARVRDPDLSSALGGIFGEKGLDLNINPEEEAAAQVQKTLSVPGASGVYEFASGKVQVVSFVVDRYCEAVGVPLFDLKGKLGIDFVIVAIERDGALVIPEGKTQIRIGDTVFAAGRPDTLVELAGWLGKSADPVRRVVIAGGGTVTYYLAQRLAEADVSVKIVEADVERCRYLAERLPRSVVLNGASTDLELLREENIENADAFLALTGDDEDNILSALLAKRAGASRVMALVNKLTYASMVSAIGVDAVVSPNLAAVSAILHFIRKGKVVGVTTVGAQAAEALEIVALETSELVGKALAEADLKDAIVGAIVRSDDVIIPGGDDLIQVGDHVVIFALKSAIARLERQMMVQLGYF